MATPYSTVYEVFLSKVNDYLIDEMYTTNVADMEAYLLPWLKSAVSKFRGCKNLNRDDGTKQFTGTLTDFEIETIAQGMVICFWQKETNDILQAKQKLYSTDFKAYAESNLLKEKRQLLNSEREIFEQMIVNYQLDNLDWTRI